MNTLKIEYKENGTTLEGYLAYNNDTKGKRPTVLIAHAWLGRDEYACKKAEELAELGYVSFAMDNFGKGVLGKHHNDGKHLKAPYMEDRLLLRRRLLAGFDTVKNMEMVDESRIAIIGYCFGGMCALDLARSGAALSGVVSFHGLFNPLEGIPANPIKAKVLALHGHDDPLVPPEMVSSLQNELTEAGVDWQIHAYGGIAHAFTNPNADGSVAGVFYDAVADNRSWTAAKNFLEEIFI